MGIIFIWLINLFRAVSNLWRKILRRRVDYVRIEIAGALPEFAPALPWWQRRFLQRSAPASLHGLRRQLERIAADPQAQGVLLRINGLAAGWATLQSFHDEIAHFRASGKRAVAFLLAPDMAGYYAACAADQIIMPPSATLLILGLRTEIQFLKDALAKVGLAAEVEAVSPYKSAGDQLTRSDISPENREQLERLLDARFAEVLRAIGEARGKTADQVSALIDMAPLSARAALDANMVDALRYEDELEAHLALGGRAPIILDWGQARRALRLPAARFYRKMVGVVTIEGTIATGSSRDLPVPLPLIGGKQSGADSVAQALRQAERNRRIAALVLYVNSPGGDAFASDLIWREVLRVRRKKPVVVAMGDAAASGGYYVAAPASAIVAQPGTLTGSIGVVMLRPIIAGLLDRAGVRTVALSRGARSGILSIAEPPTDDERRALRGLLFDSYADFKQRVREGRTLAEEQLEPIAGGRVWLGQEAVGLGLVDKLGGLPEALLRAQELANLAPDRAAPLMLLRGERTRLSPLPFPIDKPIDLAHELEAALRPRIWALLPFEIS
jgi:protease-4